MNDLLSFIDLNLPIVQNKIFIGDSVETFRKDPILRALNVIVVTHEEIFLSNNTVIASNNDVVVISQLLAHIIKVHFCKFSSHVVEIFVFEFGTESGIEVLFEIIHGEEGFEESESADWELTVVN